MPPFPSKVPVDVGEINNNLNEISRDYYGGRETNTDKQVEFSNYISQKFEEYNVKPLFEESYIDVKDVESYSKALFGKVYTSSLIIEDESKEIIRKFEKREDYSSNTYFYTLKDETPSTIKNLRYIFIS